MEHLPLYISIVFIITVLFVITLLYKAISYYKPMLVILLLWLILQMVITLSGFYTVTAAFPPRFLLLIGPPMALIAIMFILKVGRQFINKFNTKTLTLIHIIRIPIELVLYWLFVQKAIPEAMTFEGQNFDIVCGLTAPLIYYFGYVKNVLNKRILIFWNIASLILLANIMITAILSAPYGFQRLGFEQPNIAVFYFPFCWLPSFVVPSVLFAHLVSIRKLIYKY